MEDDDVRVAEARHRACFAFETREAIRVGGYFDGQHLECDLPPELGIARAVDLAHPAGPYTLDDLVGPEPGSGLQLHGRAKNSPKGEGEQQDYNGLMKKTNISTLKRDLSRYLDYVRKGGTVRVFDRQTPVADIVPMVRRGKAFDETMEALIDRLQRQGSVIRRGTGRFDPAVLRRPPVKTRRSVVEAVLEERREGR